jgi:hypothetical protein
MSEELDISKMTKDFCMWAFGVPHYEFKIDYLKKWNTKHPDRLLLYPMHKIDLCFAKMLKIYEEEKKDAV